MRFKLRQTLFDVPQQSSRQAFQHSSDLSESFFKHPIPLMRFQEPRVEYMPSDD